MQMFSPMGLQGTTNEYKADPGCCAYIFIGDITHLNKAHFKRMKKLFLGFFSRFQSLQNILFLAINF